MNSNGPALNSSTTEIKRLWDYIPNSGGVSATWEKVSYPVKQTPISAIVLKTI